MQKVASGLGFSPRKGSFSSLQKTMSPFFAFLSKFSMIPGFFRMDFLDSASIVSI